MQSRARFLSHSIHQILIVFPLGLLFTSAVFDIIGLFTNATRWHYIATYMIGAGLVGGIAAAVFGFVDFLAIPAHTRARRTGSIHGLASVAMVLLFAIAEWFRIGTPSAPSPLSLALSLGGMIVGGLAGWVGGELVTRMGIGVDDDAGLDAPWSFALPPRTDRLAGLDSPPSTPAISDRLPAPASPP